MLESLVGFRYFRRVSAIQRKGMCSKPSIPESNNRETRDISRMWAKRTLHFSLPVQSVFFQLNFNLFNLASSHYGLVSFLCILFSFLSLSIYRMLTMSSYILSISFFCTSVLSMAALLLLLLLLVMHAFLTNGQFCWCLFYFYLLNRCVTKLQSRCTRVGVYICDVSRCDIMMLKYLLRRQQELL